MKKILCIILIAVMALTMVGCEKEPNGTDNYIADGEHFSVVESWKAESQEYGTIYQAILRHNETGVCYFYVVGSHRTAMTVMLNADGTPYTGG